MGFRATRDPCLFLNDQTKAIITIYINNIIIAVPTIRAVNFVKAGLNIKYKIKDLGEAKWFFKIKIIKDCLKRTLRFDYSSYIRDFL
ncbi:hypothetical protein DL98DRAFT_616294 [Cadophora sp. DSE1049]|nr:hypothetical protein DL98DRAFT_616294 [Cadophora sp. DSE1049]